MSDIEKTNIRMADLNLLVAFDALFETRNVTRAAERLNLTQPTVSGMLARLRNMFDDQLFLRTSHGILPTPRAETLSTPIRAFLDSAEEILRPEVFDPAVASFTLRVCGSDYLTRSAIEPFVTDIRRQAPGSKASVLPRPAIGLADALARGDFDFSFNITDVALQDMKAMRLFKDRYICVARSSHPYQQAWLTLSELAARPHAFVDPTGNSMRGPIDTRLEALGHTRNVVLAVPDFSALFAALRVDDLLAFVPERLFAGEQGLRRYETEVGDLDLEVLAQWHPRYDGDARHRWLRERLRAVFRGQA